VWLHHLGARGGVIVNCSMRVIRLLVSENMGPFTGGEAVAMEPFTLRRPSCTAQPPSDFGTDDKDADGRYWCPTCGGDITSTVEAFMQLCQAIIGVGERQKVSERRQATLLATRIAFTLTVVALFLIPITRPAIEYVVSMIVVIWLVWGLIKLFATGSV
jgi:hypothetical protein